MQVKPIIELILFKSYAELKGEAARFYASFLIWIIEPIVYMVAFYIIFGLVFQRGGPDFVPFLLCGLVVWKWFAASVQQGANSILANIHLIQRVYIQKYIFPAAVLLTNALRFLVIFSLLIIFLLVYGKLPGSAWLWLPLILITQFLLNAACGGIMSAFVPFVPDIKIILEKILMLGFFMSGVFFDLSKIPEKYQFYFMLNPMAVLIKEYRKVLLYNFCPDWISLVIIALFSITGIILAQIIIIRLDRKYPKVSI